MLVDNQKTAVLTHRTGEPPSFIPASWTWRPMTDLIRKPASPTGPERREGRTNGRVCEGPLLRPVRVVRQSGSSEPAGRTMSPRGGRPTPPRNGPEDRRRPVCPGSAGASAPSGRPVRHLLPGEPAGLLGRVRGDPGEPVQRARVAVRADRGRPDRPRRPGADL